MQLNIPIEEAICIIRKKADKPINLKIVSEDTIHAEYDVNVKIPFVGNVSKTIGADVIIDKVEDNNVYFHYTTGFGGVDTLIDSVMKHASPVNSSSVIELLGEKRIVLHLKEVKQISNALDKVRIDSIAFDDNLIVVGLTAMI